MVCKIRTGYPTDVFSSVASVAVASFFCARTLVVKPAVQVSNRRDSRIENRIIIVLRFRVILSIGKTSESYAQKVRQYRLEGGSICRRFNSWLRMDGSVHSRLPWVTNSLPVSGSRARKKPVPLSSRSPGSRN